MKPIKVDFLFRGPDGVASLDGTVLVRNGKKEMVLEIAGGAGPYLIVGKAHKHWFEGINSAHSNASVRAKWADLGGTCVGIWIEDGSEYLFSFEPKA
ncbi:MAG: hypothetical protein HY040_01445 [Planctomycetes bacterium]|nr:hypothetical protein [Planctomycetota bacterium]